MLKHIKNISKELFTIPLIKLFYALQRVLFRKALNLKILLLVKLKSLIRYEINDAQLEGADEDFDETLNIACVKITNPDIFDEDAPTNIKDYESSEIIAANLSLRKKYLKKKNDVDDLINTVLKYKETKRIIEQYALVSGFIESKVGNDEASAYYLSIAQSSNPKASPLTYKQISTIERSTKKDILEFRHQIADRRALKISFTWVNSAPIISLVSGFFLLTGYLYNHFLLGAFGIETSKYFKLTDYIASSVEGIQYSLTGALVGILSFFLGAHSASRKSEYQKQQEPKFIKTDIIIFTLYTFSIIGATQGYIYDSVIFYSSSSFVIIILGMYISSSVANKYFKEPMIALFCLIFITVYSGYMYQSIGKNIYELKHYEYEKLNPYNVSIDNRLELKEDNLVLIAGNSDFFFFLNKERNTLIIPKEHILFLHHKTQP